MCYLTTGSFDSPGVAGGEVEDSESESESSVSTITTTGLRLSPTPDLRDPCPLDSCSALPATVCKRVKAWPSQMAQAVIAAAPAEKAQGVVDAMVIEID